MKTWEEIVCDRKQRYLAILKGANDVHLGWSACDELRMVLESCVPVVKCGDCKHWNSETNGCNRNPCVEAWKETDFCNYGEREENPDGDD